MIPPQPNQGAVRRPELTNLEAFSIMPKYEQEGENTV